MFLPLPLPLPFPLSLLPSPSPAPDLAPSPSPAPALAPSPSLTVTIRWKMYLSRHSDWKCSAYRPMLLWLSGRSFWELRCGQSIAQLAHCVFRASHALAGKRLKCRLAYLTSLFIFIHSGHTAVRVGRLGSLVVVFGGLVEKRFLQDINVLDTESMHWYKPDCAGSGEDGQIGPSPRAFHVSVAIDCNLFIFGGRCGRKRLGDFWMLDTDTWQWTELSGFGDLPPAREFAAGVSVGNGKIVIYGGWDGTRWLSDVYILDTISLEWRHLPIHGPVPAPRCGHTATMVEKRMLIFGGRGGGGPIMGDLWALKGLFDEEREPPAWTQLKLPGTAPASRCGHSTTSGGPQLLIFGGHSTGGWLTRYDVYHNDSVILDRASVLWKKLPVTNEPPPRAYHTMTRIGSRFLLIGGYDGKSTFGDIWWLVAEDDPIAKRASLSPRSSVSPAASMKDSEATQDKVSVSSPSHKLRQRLGLPPSAAVPFAFDTRAHQQEVIALYQRLLNIDGSTPKTPIEIVKAVREHWSQCDVQLMRMSELSPLLRDYQFLVAGLQRTGLLESFTLDGEGEIPKLHVHRFYHFQNASQLRMDDIPSLLNEYKQLLHLHSQAKLVDSL